MKLFMQVLWLRNIDWDTVLPADVMQRWEGVCNNLTTVTEIHIPRWLQYSNEKYVELHGYADASELAFAAVIYLKVVHDDGKISTRLVASKTRVAPVKQVTLPRLELCAAHLAAKLLARVRNTLNIQHVVLHGWSDSTIVLAWLSDQPRRWKNFVANRTSHIISILPSQYWHHVRSAENPADLATRGLSPAELVNSRLWWQGPTSLQDQQQQQHDEYIPVPDNVDMERRTTVVCQINVEDGHGLINRYSNYNRLLRITALIIRFVRNCQPRSNKKVLGRITTIELQRALITVVKLSQGISFESEVRMLTANKALPVNHKLSPLLPFIDENGLLRVGGRLVNAEIPYDQKYPVILHKDNKLTALLITYYHLHYLHAGSRQLQYLIGLKYWIPSITYAIKRCVYKCTICMRYRSKPFTQQMGNLPKPRLMTAIVFQNVGVDFAGPMLIRSWKGRGTKLYKCWVSLFVCLATKAVHLELVTALSSEAFIATLRRFIARRGKPVNIYSDNGTNFVGCNKQLNDMRRFLLAEGTQDRVTKETGSQGINWHFSPPSGPHFGGLWEAGVKSMKNHLNRVLHQNSATYEELNTVLCQVEACLNSRPLCAKFQGNLDPLTPAHFLIHRNMESILDENYTSTKINLLTRWQYLQQLTQTFWKKWSNDYLKQLQSRPKWAQKLKNVQVDDLVIIKDDQLPPTKWSIGRVVDTHPGADGLVRVVTIFTKTGTYKRPVHKLCPLFVDC